MFRTTYPSILVISFSVGKRIAPSDPEPQDLNLNGAVYVLWGIRPGNSTAGMVPAHATGPGNNPAASEMLVNPATGAMVTIPVS